MIDEERLDQWRISGEKVRVIRDAEPGNDVRGIVVAWDAEHVLIRRPNRKVVKLSRKYKYESARQPRSSFENQ